ncbi:RNA 3'-phosphate cyclase, partial [Candidatus Micrarchaeota archaeon]|nr:RNA 3'-phosphate cyclase [Candidatus Micrarchaeota archaeon]
MQIVEIDSLAVGEGGGQVLRSAISLASILRKPVRVFNIRAGRPNPGLQAQHITGIESLARLVNASVSGLSKGSLELVFKPSEIRTMDFELDIGTAGSVTLVLQALLPVLAFAKGKSRFTVVGGTHVAWSPTIHYVQNVFLPIMRGIGYSITVESKQYGWYPKGGGKILVETEPVKKLKKLDLVKRGNLLDVRGISCASNLPQNVVERQAGACKNLVGNVQMELEVTQALCPGTAVT